MAVKIIQGIQVLVDNATPHRVCQCENKFEYVCFDIYPIAKIDAYAE